MSCLRGEGDKTKKRPEMSGSMAKDRPPFIARYPPRQRALQDVLLDIIGTIYAGHNSKKDIMIHAKLSYTQGREFIAFMLDKRLIVETSEGSRKYSVTELGAHWYELQRESNGILLRVYT